MQACTEIMDIYHRKSSGNGEEAAMECHDWGNWSCFHGILRWADGMEFHDGIRYKMTSSLGLVIFV